MQDIIGIMAQSDFLHDPQFITTTFIGLLAIVVTLWIFRKQRTKRELSYQVVSFAPIASIDKTVKDKVEVLFDGKPAKDARLMVIEIWNTGNLAVKREDYSKQVTLEFKGTSVLVSNVLYTQPRDLFEPEDKKTFLKIEQDKEGDKVKLAKFTFNPNRGVRFAILLKSAPTEEMQVRGIINMEK